MKSARNAIGLLIILLMSLVTLSCEVDDGIVGYVYVENMSHDYVAVEYEGYQLVDWCEDEPDDWITGYDYEYDRDLALIPPGKYGCIRFEETHDCTEDYCEIFLRFVPYAEEPYCYSGHPRIPCVYEVYPTQTATVTFSRETDEDVYVEIYDAY